MSNQFVKLSEDGTKATITLPRKYTLGGKEVDTLEMREPTVDDQLAADEAGSSPASVEVNLFANLCMVTPKEIGALGIKAYKRIQDAYRLFTD